MEMKIEIYNRPSYGNNNLYPANDTAKLFLKLTKRKTFLPEDIITMRSLGYEVTFVLEPKLIESY